MLCSAIPKNCAFLAKFFLLFVSFVCFCKILLVAALPRQVLASWREQFMGQLRVADVSRKGAKARKRFPGLTSWRWILHADCQSVGRRAAKTGFLLCPPDFYFQLSQFPLFFADGGGIPRPAFNHSILHPFNMLYDSIATGMPFSACFDHFFVKLTQVTVYELFTRTIKL